MAILRKMLGVLVRLAPCLFALAAFVGACSYVLDAHQRTTRLSGCNWNVVENPDRAPYSARFCYLTKDTVLLRLYDVKGKQLLAERTFINIDHPNFVFDREELIYDTSSRDGGKILLPPNIVDQWLARLP
jgi:hypothetical protein